MRTLRIGKVELYSARERAGGHDLDDGDDREDREVRGPRPRLAKGTPWTTSVPRPLLEEEGHDVPAAAAADPDDPDDALIRASPLAQLDPHDDDEPLPPVGVEVELGMRPLVGLGAGPYTAMRAVVDAAVSARWAIAYGSVEVKHAPPVQPPPAERSRGSAETSAVAAASPALARAIPVPAHGTAPVAHPPLAFERPVRGRSRGRGWRTSVGSRVLGVLLLAAAAAALAAFLTTTVF